MPLMKQASYSQKDLSIMVYCGKPSKGCANCRKRRIRCDQTAPSCGQCTKIKKECPGYRDMLDLSFRHEYSSVIEKVNARNERKPARRKKPQSTEWEPEPSTKAIKTGCGQLPTPPKLFGWDTFRFTHADYLEMMKRNGSTSPIGPMSTFSMYPTIEDRGMAYFAANFVTPPGGPTHGSFTSLYEIKQFTGTLDDTLVAGITATGLAGFANTAKSAEVMRHARRQYAIALQLINKALGSPEDALKDSTLLAVLILAIFETTAGSKQLSLKEWRHHMNGAAALLKLRGRPQLWTPIGFKLFMHASTHVMVGCLHREIAMPPELLELRQEAFQSVSDEPVWQYLKTADEFTIFRGAVRSGTLSDPEEIITAALIIDRKLLQIFIDIPPGWIYEKVVSEVEQYVVFEKRYDIYYDHCIAQTWNGMHTARIMLNETICFQLTRLNESRPGYASQWEQSTQICVEMSYAILRSVPQHLGYIARLPFQGDGSTAHITESLKRDPSHPSLGSWFLLWPLYIAATTRVATAEMRAYAGTILDYVGETIGIKQGTNLASFIRDHSAPGHEAAGASLGMAVDKDGKRIGALRVMMDREDAERGEIERMVAAGKRGETGDQDDGEREIEVEIDQRTRGGYGDGRSPLTDAFVRLYDNSYGKVRVVGLRTRLQTAAEQTGFTTREDSSKACASAQTLRAHDWAISSLEADSGKV
ncbi:hypothetical protein DL98DRAFT_564942 [Cadophora sp. DSE1049]|nr:hypothetical protein DL98DRAFT_564942 [Cadophora sp. DSE1049]